MGMLIHSSFMYEDEKLQRDSKKAWVLSMTAGVEIVGWMFLYGYICKFFMSILFNNQPAKSWTK